MDAVVSLPLNVFYGAGLPACLLILRKDRPDQRRETLLLIYAARHYRELSAQNELRPQDVMRILVHYHAYGDAAHVPSLVQRHRERIVGQINAREADDIGVVLAEYGSHETALARLTEIRQAEESRREHETIGAGRRQAETAAAKLLKQEAMLTGKLAERDEQIAAIRRRATEDREDLDATSAELLALYSSGDDLNSHIRVVDRGELVDNDFNLNIPRYVDTFEPEPYLDLGEALTALAEALDATGAADAALRDVLTRIGHASE